jgi:RNA polymerase sigma-70 factor, ECF subfamily
VSDANQPFDDSEASDLSDADLLRLLQAGEKSAAVEIYERYAQRLLRLANKNSSEQLARRVAPEDIVQSVFRTFFRRATEGHYELPDGDELWKLFLVISLNKMRKKAVFHNAAKRDIGRTQSIGSSQISGPEAPSDVLRMTIDEMISTLPEEHQGIIRDRIHGYEITEIAARNLVSRRTTERILQNFRSRLLEELSE